MRPAIGARFTCTSKTFRKMLTRRHGRLSTSDSSAISIASITPSAAANHELNKVARLTGGQFFQAQDARALLSIFAAIDQLEKRELIQKRFVSWRELYPWFLGAGALAWVLQLGVSEVVRRRIP